MAHYELNTIKEINGYRVYFPQKDFEKQRQLIKLLKENGYHPFCMVGSEHNIFVVIPNKSEEAVLRLIVVDEIPSQDICHNVPETSYVAVKNFLDESNEFVTYCTRLSIYFSEKHESFANLVNMANSMLIAASFQAENINLISYAVSIDVLSYLLMSSYQDMVGKSLEWIKEINQIAKGMSGQAV